MRRLWAHCRRVWPRFTLLPAAPLPLYCAVMAALGMLRWDHVFAAATFLLLAYLHPRTRRFLTAFTGFFAVGILYDSGRFVRDLGVTEERVINCGLRELERSFLGVTDGGARITWQDYFQVHHSLAADLFFSVPYATFIAVCVLYAVYLFTKDERACARFSWAFFLLNVMGMVTYHLVPCAPPWYFHKYGCAIHLDVSEFEGNALARVDAWTGVGYFRGFYGRAAEVFGALPSLHVAYPLLVVLEGWRRHGWPGRSLSLFFFAWMCVAAIYLDHHWVTDLVLGWVYAGVVFVALRRLTPSTDARPVSISGFAATRELEGAPARVGEQGASR